MLRAALPLVLAASVNAQRAPLQASDIPLAMLQLCAGNVQGDQNTVGRAALQNMISWNNVPHDWDKENPSTWKGDSNGRHQGKDWWYWGDDWKTKIADGQAVNEPEAKDEATYATSNNFLGVCGRGHEKIGNDRSNIATLSECSKACAFEFSTQDLVREKCTFFSYDAHNKKCRLYKRCGWPYQISCNDPSNCNVGNVRQELTAAGYDLSDTACYGGDTLSPSCSWSETTMTNTPIWKTYTLRSIYPAGFRSYSLREFNEPPLCLHVPNSSDKKVEVMIETEMNDSRICVTDGRDMGVFNNDVGNVRTCDNGQLYTCFTAANTNSRTNGNKDDFFFYISCEGSCEASDVDLWIRMRVSENDWNSGKQKLEDDIEYWCEDQRATTYSKDGEVRDEFTFPHELLPEEPREYPYRITHSFPDSAGALSTALACLAGLAAAMWVM